MIVSEELKGLLQERLRGAMNELLLNPIRAMINHRAFITIFDRPPEHIFNKSTCAQHLTELRVRTLDSPKVGNQPVAVPVFVSDL